jgi:hypothetical protein
MGMILLIVVFLAALLTIASGVWVAIALMSALRYRNGKETPVESPPTEPLA